ncbi:Protein cwh43 [Marasmius crinis-equi]|uniref:Protein cwh43 n=1 Tax=Marasmius crinis-equi TaxID=585013 RepID=A0ABR3FFD3_9AGAR
MSFSRSTSSTKHISPPNVVLRASQIARAHTILAYSAFGSALLIGSLLHYKKIVKNGVAGYPEEWFPSVSATIGDWYPERNVFQILIALTSGPRFCLVAFQYFLHRSPTSSLPTIIFICGILRTLSCGGWVYITSSDDHDIHDVCMISYILLNIPWMVGGIMSTPVEHTSVRRKRVILASVFFLTTIPLIYFFIQHKVHRIPGAYTHYSFFEWGLILFDILYDSFTEEEFRLAELDITIGSTAGFQSSSKANPVEKVIVSREKPVVAVEAEIIEPDATTEITHWRATLAYISDAYLSYIFWSIFTSLIPTIFYFSVWELGISGSELAFLATLSPIFLGIPPFRAWASTRTGRATLQLFSFAGLGAFALQSPTQRLFVVTPATAIAVIRQVIDWKLHPTYSSLMTVLGFMLSSLLKHANHSNNPVWPIVDHRSGGYNKTGLFLALLALAELYTRPISAHPPSERDQSKPPQESTLTAALPLGSLLFVYHNFLSEPATLVAWSWTGYENGRPRGPLPGQHGSITLITQCVGVLLAVALLRTKKAHLLTHPIWFVVGGIGVYVMYHYRNWRGYGGSLVYALFSMSVTPLAVIQASKAKNVTRTYFIAMLVYCVLMLAAVWAVAYAFVPGGEYLRERTGLILIMQMTCLSLAFRRPKSQTPHSVLSPSLVSFTRTIVACICVLSVLATLYLLPSSPAAPHRPGPRIFRAGIWTVHFGIDNEGRDSQRRMRDLIKGMELDIVGLLETDLHRPVYGNRDLTRVIAEEGYYVDLGPGPNLHTWGAVLLSKFPIINSTHHLLPSPDGELAPAIEAVLDVFGTPVVVIVSHNGQEETPLDRELQSQELGRIMASHYPKPTIFLGYVVTNPKAPKPQPYKYLVEDGKMHDIDESDWDRWCEYILYRGVYRTSYARVSRSTITDTELQVGQFILPKHGWTVTNETHEARYLRNFKETLPVEHWFPMEYYGDENQGGVNGHFYHVFNTPLYYNIPDGAIL